MEEVKYEFEYLEECDINRLYCRCCFKQFTDTCLRLDFSFDFLNSMTDLFQLNLKMEDDDCSQWICGLCYGTVTNFKKFKTETLEKQAKFSMLMATNQHKDLNKIQDLSMTTVALRLDYQNEPEIKDEPMDILQETVIIEMPIIKPTKPKYRTKRKGWRPKPKKKKVQKKGVLSMPHRPSYERNTKPVKCDKCGQTFMNIITHQIKKHGRKFRYTCDKDHKCKFSTYDRNEYLRHRISHDPFRSGREKSLCPYCAKIIRASTLDIHIKNVHLQERYYFCDLCEFSSFQKKSLQAHMEGRHMEKQVTCQQCGFKTNTQARLEKHIDYRHTDRVRERNFVCPIEECKKTFETKYYLDDHNQRVHVRTLNFPCKHPNCEKSFHTNVERNNHMQAVHGEKYLNAILTR
jgi:hypothetical protein